MISRIEAYRYRCFQKLDLALDKYQVFAGSNGSGKTTFLDIPALLGDMIRVSDINDAFFKPINGRERARAEYAQELVHKLRGEDFTLAIEVKLPESVVDILIRTSASGWQTKFSDSKKRPDTIRYEVALRINNDKLIISEEHVLVFPDNEHRPEHGAGLVASEDVPANQPWCRTLSRSWGEKARYKTEYQTGNKSVLKFGLRNEQAALSSVPADNDLYPATLWLHDYLLENSFSYEPQWPAMRMAVSPRERGNFCPDGRSLPWQIFELKENQPDAYIEWLELVQMTLPRVTAVEAKQRADDGYCYLVVSYENGMEVPSTSLSHGTLHLLALTIVPYIENAPYVLTLEEPENGIHPKAIHAVLEALSIASQTQIWMSTHSPVVLANTSIESIVTMRFNDEGETEVVKGIDHPRLKNWKGEVDLGTLFAAGVLE